MKSFNSTSNITVKDEKYVIKTEYLEELKGNKELLKNKMFEEFEELEVGSKFKNFYTLEKEAHIKAFWIAKIYNQKEQLLGIGIFEESQDRQNHPMYLYDKKSSYMHPKKQLVFDTSFDEPGEFGFYVKPKARCQGLAFALAQKMEEKLHPFLYQGNPILTSGQMSACTILKNACKKWFICGSFEPCILKQHNLSSLSAKYHNMMHKLNLYPNMEPEREILSDYIKPTLSEYVKPLKIASVKKNKMS